MATVQTKILVLSDTHGLRFPPGRQLPKDVDVDVVLHCGDMSEESKIAEFHTTLDMLNSICAPLTLVVAGNHDFTLDLPAFHQKVAEAGLAAVPELVAREYTAATERRASCSRMHVIHTTSTYSTRVHTVLHSPTVRPSRCMPVPTQRPPTPTGCSSTGQLMATILSSATTPILSSPTAGPRVS
jgi:hypothetical protein